MSNRITIQESQITSKEDQDRIRSIAAENVRRYLEIEEEAEERMDAMLERLIAEMKQS